MRSQSAAANRNTTTTVHLIGEPNAVAEPSVCRGAGSTMTLICFMPPAIQTWVASSRPAAIEPTASVVTKEGTKAFATKRPLIAPIAAPQTSPSASAPAMPKALVQPKLVTSTPTSTATRSATATKERSNSPMTSASVAARAKRSRLELLLTTLTTFWSVMNVVGRRNEKVTTIATKTITIPHCLSPSTIRSRSRMLRSGGFRSRRMSSLAPKGGRSETPTVSAAGLRAFADPSVTFGASKNTDMLQNW
jgi:hypothetical protein